MARFDRIAISIEIMRAGWAEFKLIIRFRQKILPSEFQLNLEKIIFTKIAAFTYWLVTLHNLVMEV